MKNRWIAVALIGSGVVLMASWMRARGQAVNAPPEQKPVVRVYDIRDLLDSFQDFTLATSWRGGAFSDGLAPLMPFGYIGNGPAVPAQPTNNATRQDRVDSLIKSIEAATAQDSWKDNGGSQGSLHEDNGMLIVGQTPENQKLVKNVLDQMSELSTQMVRTEADWIWLAPADVSKLLKPAGNDPAAAATEQVDPAALLNLAPGARHFHAEVMGRNGQTVYVVSGRVRSLVTNVTPVVSTATSSFAPTVSDVAGGLAFQVSPLAKVDRGYAIVTFYGTYDELGAPREAGAAAVAGVAYEPPSTQPAPTTSPASPGAEPTRRPVPTAQPMAASVVSKFNTIGMKIQETRTTVRVPLGRPVIVEEATWDPTAKDHHPPLQLVLILTETLVK